MKAKYINPFTDFGFKKLFGEEVNKDLWDLKNVIDTAEEEGFERGLEEGREQGNLSARLLIARNALAQGFSDDMVIALTGLSLSQIGDLKK